MIQCLRAQGAQTVIISEVAEVRKTFANQFGATRVVDPTREDLVQTCKDYTKGRGVQVIFDAAGVQPALDRAMECLRVHGTLVNIALWAKPASFNANRMVLKERRYQGSVTYTRGDFQEVLTAIALGTINPSKMITKTIKVLDSSRLLFLTRFTDMSD